MKNYKVELMNTFERKAAAARIMKLMRANARFVVDSKTADKIANEAKHKSRRRK